MTDQKLKQLVSEAYLGDPLNDPYKTYGPGADIIVTSAWFTNAYDDGSGVLFLADIVFGPGLTYRVRKVYPTTTLKGFYDFVTSK